MSTGIKAKKRCYAIERALSKVRSEMKLDKIVIWYFPNVENSLAVYIVVDMLHCTLVNTARG
jgi:hypothetical protein